MKHSSLLIAMVIVTLAACEKKPSEEPFVPTPRPLASTELPAGHPPMNNNGQTSTLSGGSDETQTQTATVVSTIDVSQFTYLEVTQGKQTRWLAASTTSAKKGDVIKFDEGSTMADFNSKALDRTFPSITFVNRATIVKRK